MSSEKKRVTYEAIPVVWISIRGRSIANSLMRDDGGLCARFIRWCAEQGIVPAIFAGSSGGGEIHQAYSVQDAGRAVAWLKENGAERREQERGAIE